MGEVKSCQNCKTEFEIDASDAAFYAKVGVPAPTLCPDCRSQRRMAMRNERTFYRRTCNSCGKQLIAYYPPEKPQVVWCPECWYSDRLDAMSYGRDLDFSRPFFEQFKEMYVQIPTLSLDVVNCHDSEYVSYCGDDKRCYLDIAGEANIDCHYCKFVKYSSNCIDCSFVYNSELSYECVNCHKIYGSTFLNRCLDSTNCHFCYDCRGCTDCFGCWNLRNKQYYIFNQPYSKDEYRKKVQEFNRGSYSAFRELQKDFAKHSKAALVRFATLTNCVRCTGDVQKNCKNVQYGFDATEAENSKWLYDVLDAKECYDLNFSLYKPEMSMELISTLNMTYSGFCNASHYCNHVWYSDKCNNSSDLFGCIALQRKKYCIMNKQYSKEEYEALRAKIVEYMKETGEWGQYFPIGTSGFGYNETVAQEYFPLTKEECERRSHPWWDRQPYTRGKETVKTEGIADLIEETSDSITNEILACAACGRNYRITPYELGLYRKIGVPVPRECPECRHLRRNAVAGERRLWRRACTCIGMASEIGGYQNTADHFHAAERCPNTFETAYPPESPAIVYCEQCYQSEVT